MFACFLGSVEEFEWFFLGVFYMHPAHPGSIDSSASQPTQTWTAPICLQLPSCSRDGMGLRFYDYWIQRWRKAIGIRWWFLMIVFVIGWMYAPLCTLSVVDGRRLWVSCACSAFGNNCVTTCFIENCVNDIRTSSPMNLGIAMLASYVAALEGKPWVLILSL